MCVCVCVCVCVCMYVFSMQWVPYSWTVPRSSSPPKNTNLFMLTTTTVGNIIRRQIVIVFVCTALSSTFSLASNLLMSFNNVSEYRFISTL